MGVKVLNDNQIIMVDDSEIDTLIMRKYFEKSDLTNEFLVFHLGEEFLAYMDETKAGQHPMPALVFMDINMPRMSGFDVLRELRKSRDFDAIPVVTFLTSSDNENDIERCHELNTYMHEKFSDTEECVAFLNNLIP
jgi:CheY-like chemotaxis protein